MLLWQPLKQKNNKAFTLIELIFVVGLSLLLLTSLYAVYIICLRSYGHSVARAEIDQNARISFERITRDLRQTTRIVTVLPPTDTDPLNPAPSQITFQDGHDITQLRYIVYAKENNNLMRKVIHYYFSTDPDIWVAYDAKDEFKNPPLESIDENVVKADEIQTLEFFGGPSIVSIKAVIADQNNQLSYQTQVMGRNLQ